MQKAAIRFLAASCLCLTILIAPPFSAQLAVTELSMPAQSPVLTEEPAAAAALPVGCSISAAASLPVESAASSNPENAVTEESAASADTVSSQAEASEPAAAETAVPAEISSSAPEETASSAPEESAAPEEAPAPDSEPAPAESAEPAPEEGSASSSAESTAPAPAPVQEAPAAQKTAVIQQTGSISGGDLYYSGVRQMLDTVPLQPMASTGNADLDARLDAIFPQIISDGMDTHDKLKACYDYLINNIYYQTSSWSVVSPNDLYSSSYNYAYHLLKVGYGVCDSYSAAFAVMAHRIGLPMYTVRGDTSASGGGYISDHVWCQIDYNGVSYIFDPQVEDNIARSKGYIMYIRFGGTSSRLSDCYWDGSELCDFTQTCSDRYFE